jgi:type IV pilus assembly protein PilY1
MKRCLSAVVFLNLFLGVFFIPSGFAVDQFVGDTAIYGGINSLNNPPNVLFVIDDSRPMETTTSTSAYYDIDGDGRPDYDQPRPTYTPVTYTTDAIYRVVSLGHYNRLPNPTLADVQAHCPQAWEDLYKHGSTLTYLDTNGYCDDSHEALMYVLGNYLNFRENSPTSTLTAIEQVRQAVQEVANLAQEKVHIGLMTFGQNNRGGRLVYKVQDISTQTFSSDPTVIGTSDFETRLAAITNPANLLASNTQPIAEALWDAGTYLGGRYGTLDRLASISYTPPLTAASPWPSPIEWDCQPNVIVMITMGNAIGSETVAATADQSGGDMVDVARWLATHNLKTKQLIGPTDDPDTIPHAKVDMIQAFYQETSILRNAAAAGWGDYYNVQNKEDLKEALLETIVNIVSETNTAFVAPVVPTSPENRTYSGSRVYLGLFQPKTQSTWYGNLKKYGIDTTNEIVDKNETAATAADGNFLQDTVSYWSDCSNASDCGDGGMVTQGGVGGVLLARDFVPSDPAAAMHAANDPRNIYTYLGGVSKDLADSTNRFDTDNSALSWDTKLDLSSSGDKTPLIKYVYGLDAYDDDPYERDISPTHQNDGVTQEKRRWVMGDILHSKPLVLGYNSYAPGKEGVCTWSGDPTSYNKSVVYVGTNDGMLHAFRDCDGRELWGFIPPAVLPNLQYLHGAEHNFYVDGTPTAYVYDANHNGVIESGNGDKVVILFGLRRGGSAYYALDVTDPLAPKYLWEINSSGSSEALGESWSQPQLGKIKVGSQTKIVAFVGAGYDNDNEDSRFGNTQLYTNAGVDPLISDRGQVTSGGTTVAGLLTAPKGRGVFAFEVATLDNLGVPTVPSSPAIVWQFTADTSSVVDSSDEFNRYYLEYSVPSDVAVLDTDFDGYTDRLYVGDTGGQMWRVSKNDSNAPYLPIASPYINEWSGRVIFKANPGGEASETPPATPTNGRKIFFRPSVAYEHNYIGVYFGTGDRAHPLNTAVTDRTYAVYDRGQITSNFIGESSIVNVTTDALQGTDLSLISPTLSSLFASGNHGWFIKLDQHAGEKVLAPALVFNKVAYYTTYAPLGTGVLDPCTPGDLGQSRLYAVDYQTGEAVFNFYRGNDTQNNTNTRAAGENYVLRREDRSIDLGVGIPSGLVMVINASGDAKVLIGCGGGICKGEAKEGGTIIPIYWLPW